MAKILRRLVSKKKRRYQLDGFDLDLAYIDCSGLSSRLLAMAFPCEGKEAWYRNSLKEVRQFLEFKNDRGGMYKVYNLTTERPQYSSEKLGGLLATYGFEDHQVPSLEQMLAFCEDLDSFLNQHPHNFAAVHCKAGKGRTGVMICAYLLHKGYVTNAQEAMEIYARQRSKNSSGVTVASQQRYIQYFEAVVTDGRIPPPAALALESICISGMSSAQLSELVVRVSSRSAVTGEITLLTEVAASPACLSSHRASRFSLATPTVELRPEQSCGNVCVVERDVKVEVYHCTCVKKRLLFRTWFNTAFISPGSYTLRDWELDKGVRSVKPGTVMRLHFAEAPERCSGSSVDAESDQDGQESLPVLMLPCTDSPVSDTIPAINLQHATSPSAIETSRTNGHIFDVHPDFSIPSTFCTSPAAPPPTPPFRSAFPSSTHLPVAPGAANAAGAADSTVRQLTERLESLAHNAATEDGSSAKPSRVTKRSFSNPFPHIKCSMKEMLAPPRDLNLVRTRTSLDRAFDDPESRDLSAPTTPSLPRPFDTFDWRHEHETPAQCTPNTANARTTFGNRHKHRCSFQEGTASGPDSPSHGARLIKWMSASWWLDMA